MEKKHKPQKEKRPPRPVPSPASPESDPDGSYTGVPCPPETKPTQDADDL